MRPDPTPAKASKAVASRYYQLRTGHALIGPHLKKIGKRASDTCWWCDRGVKQSSMMNKQKKKNLDTKGLFFSICIFIIPHKSDIPYITHTGTR